MTVWDELNSALAGIPRLPGAACRGMPATFDLDAGDDPAALERARAICAACPALVDCRAWVASLPRRRRPSGVVAGELLAAPVPPREAPPPPPRPEPPTRPTLADAATVALAEYLAGAGGPVPAAAVKAALRERGLGKNAVHAAAQRLGVVRVRSGQRTFAWRLPQTGQEDIA